jgi:hypothetical protein
MNTQAGAGASRAALARTPGKAGDRTVPNYDESYSSVLVVEDGIE